MASKPTFRGQRWLWKRRLDIQPPDVAGSPDYVIIIQKLTDLNLVCFKTDWRSKIDHFEVGVLYSIHMYRWRSGGWIEGRLEPGCRSDSRRIGLPHQQSERTQNSGLCSNVSDLLIFCVNLEWNDIFWDMMSHKEVE
jgi:hypothetical protein